MKKALIIIFMMFYGLGILLCPVGDFSCSQSLAAEYEQCKTEDADIDVADFVVEHLLNLEVVIAPFEHEENEQNDKPHQPLQQLQSSSLIVVLVSKVIRFEPQAQPAFAATAAAYAIYKGQNIPTGYLTEVFHPPSVC